MTDRTLRLGDRGADVQQAQDMLNRDGALLDTDGQFGPATEGALRACQASHGLSPSGEVDPGTWTMLRALSEPCPGLPSRAVTFIALEEVSSRAFYERNCACPTWPGEQSGVTIGVGYDLRFEPALEQDWGGLLPSDQIAALKPWLGKPGSREAVAALAGVEVPWHAAWTVFVRKSLPGYIRETRSAFPGFDRLPPLCHGALVSLVYNRGTDMNGERRTEMRQIRDAIAAGNASAVPDLLRAMKRLWPNSAGLRGRRDREANLFEEGLTAS